MKKRDDIQSEQSKINNNNSQILTKNNLNYLENSLNSSNILTSNNYMKSKETKENNKKNEINILPFNNSKFSTINDNNCGVFVKNIIVDNKYLRKTGMKQKKKHVDNDIALYQDFVLDGFKNVLSTNKRNAIERLGDCIERKYQSLEHFENNQKSGVFKDYKKYQKVLMGSQYDDEKKLRSVYNQSNIKGNNNNSMSTMVKDKTFYINNSNKKKHFPHSTNHILDKKNQGDFPLLLSSPLSYVKKFNSYSEKERNERNILSLLKLRHFLNIYWRERKELVKELFYKFNLNEPFFYEDNHLDNFAHFVKDNIDINNNNVHIETRYPMSDIALKGIKYKPFSNIKKNIKRSSKFLNEQLSKSTGELVRYDDSKSRIAKYRKYLNKNYKQSVTNKLLKGLSKDEKFNYFGKKKFGYVEISDRNNLANNLEKQALYSKRYNSMSTGNFCKGSIKYFNDDDLKKLNEELNIVSNSIIKKFECAKSKKTEEKILGEKKYKGLNDKIIDKLNQRLYYTIKEKYHLSHPEVIPTQKKKLLEYIIVQKLKERKNFEQKLWDDMNMNKK